VVTATGPSSSGPLAFVSLILLSNKTPIRLKIAMMKEKKNL